VFFRILLNHSSRFFFFFVHKRNIFIIEMMQRVIARDFCFIDFVVFIDSLESSFDIGFSICHL